MAEGPVVVRWARQLQRLVGEPLEAVELSSRFAGEADSLVGRHVARVDTHGKHLMLHFSDGRVLHCHALMYGSWRIGRAGMALHKPAKSVRVRLRTAEREAVFFNGPVAEVLSPEAFARHPKLNALGPDVMTDGFERDEAWRRLQADPRREIGDAILDQNVVAGIGNVYKSEALFLARIDPRRPCSRVARPEAERLWNIVIPLMWGEVKSGSMRTLPRTMDAGRQNHWVYRRRGQPCFRCEAKIVRIEQGKNKRSSYFCPECQPRRAPSEPIDPIETAVQQRLPGTG